MGGDVGAEYDAGGPIRGETGIVIGVEMREKVGDGKIASALEAIDDESRSRDELGKGEIGGDWSEIREKLRI